MTLTAGAGDHGSEAAGVIANELPMQRPDLGGRDRMVPTNRRKASVGWRKTTERGCAKTIGNSCSGPGSLGARASDHRSAYRGAVDRMHTFTATYLGCAEFLRMIAAVLGISVPLLRRNGTNTGMDAANTGKNAAITIVNGTNMGMNAANTGKNVAITIMNGTNTGKNAAIMRTNAAITIMNGTNTDNNAANMRCSPTVVR